MAPRKYESGHQKLKKKEKKKRIEKLIESQKGALEKFVTSNFASKRARKIKI